MTVVNKKQNRKRGMPFLLCNVWDRKRDEDEDEMW